MFTLLIIGFSISAAGQNLFQNGNMEEEGAWQILRLQNEAGDILTMFGETADSPTGASGKCFKAEFTGTEGTSQIFVYQLLDLTGGHTYKFQCFFKDITPGPGVLENTWVETLWIDPAELPEQDGGDIAGNVFLGINCWRKCGPGDDGNMVLISCDELDPTYSGTDSLNDFVYFKVYDTLGGETITDQPVNLAVGFTVGMWTDTTRSFEILLDEFYLEDTVSDASAIHPEYGSSDPVKIYPNPATDVATIEYVVPKQGMIRLTLHNVVGQQISEFLKMERMAGTFEYAFSVADLPGGTYFCKLEMNNQIITRKIIVLKEHRKP